MREDYESCEGVSDEEHAAKLGEWHRNHPRTVTQAIQTSGRKFIGTPRLAKHKGDRINGVRIK